MEVLKQKRLVDINKVEKNLDTSLAKDIQGEELLQTLVDLTGLPGTFAQNELHEILDSAGETQEKRADITLEELRAALIRYLETMDPELAHDTVSEPDLEVDGKIPLPT